MGLDGSRMVGWLDGWMVGRIRDIKEGVPSQGLGGHSTQTAGVS